jgi:putative AlgH/UPF0301 family transcriptional regulator
VQIRPGSLLIAHPTNSHPNRTNQVIYVTSSNEHDTNGLILNILSDVDLRMLLLDKGIDWQGDCNLYIGGDSCPNAIIMLHTDEWYSSNTVQIDNNWSMSSDGVMMEKLDMGNSPEWYRLFAGYETWDADDLEHQLRSSRPEWILLAKPSQALIELADNNLWQTAVTEYSQDVFDTYF